MLLSSNKGGKMFEEFVKYSKILLIIAFFVPIGIGICKYKKYRKYIEDNKNLLGEKDD